MSMRCSNANAPYVSRKKYMKNYMRKRREQSDKQRQNDRKSSLKSKSKARQSKEFQEKELAAKRHNRLNPETKEKERESTLKSKSKARQSKEFQEKELAAKRHNRLNPETKEKERESTLNSKSKARQSKEFQEKELTAKRHNRLNPEIKEKDRESTLKSKSKARQSKEIQEKELAAKRHSRLNPETKEKNRESTLKSMKKARQSKEFQEKELTAKRHNRQKPETPKKERESTLKSMKKARQSKEFQEKELTAKRHNRQKPETPKKERESTLKSMKKARQSKEFQEKELTAKRHNRQKPETPKKERESTLKSMKKARQKNVRPNMVLSALHWLMDNSEMYKSSGIKIDQTWKNTIENSDCEIVQELTGSSSNSDDRESEANDDGFCEVALDERVQGNSDTLVDEADLDTNKTYVFAPASREVVFINTSPPEERIFLLKCQDDLNKLPKTSTNIRADSLIQRYERRPKQLEHWCLADFVSELEVTFPKEMQREFYEEENDDNPQVLVDNLLSDCDNSDQDTFSDNDTVVHLKNGIKIRRRKNKRVIRYVGYSQKTNSEEYYRERLLLYLPWRNENSDLLGGFQTYEQHYRQKANMIQMKQKQYEHFVDEIEQARLQAEEDLDSLETVAPNTEHAEADDAEIDPVPSEEFAHFDPDSAQHKVMI
uniref:Splicing regulatory glutamine/lysine-rich protein 1-like n=1 Tax=Crassostrea virginica TaxID=6565 RepID=A0A8B8C6D0_CRAVI|nr:splicing regulatory glutamine/lysine-rich protein 1-like [Crassostrea virginica]